MSDAILDRDLSDMVYRQPAHNNPCSQGTRCVCPFCAVFFEEPTPHLPCPLDMFTPNLIALTRKLKLGVQVGTGKGTWDGREIVKFVEDEHHFRTNGADLISVPLDFQRLDQCQKNISKPMIESAVKKLALGRSLEPHAVVSLFEEKTGTRAPTSNTLLRNSDEWKTPMQVRSVENFQIQKSSLGRGLEALKDKGLQRKLKAAIVPMYQSIESRICSYDAGAQFLDFVLMRAFLAVSGTSFAELHDRAMQRFLSVENDKPWMLVACAPEVKVKRQYPSPRQVAEHDLLLHQHFQFTLKGKQTQRRTLFLPEGNLAEINLKGVSLPTTCAVLASFVNLDQKLSSCDDSYFQARIAYFTRDKQGKDEVWRSAAGEVNPWKFFQSKPDCVALRKLLANGSKSIWNAGRSPPVNFSYLTHPEDFRRSPRGDHSSAFMAIGPMIKALGEFAAS